MLAIALSWLISIITIFPLGIFSLHLLKDKKDYIKTDFTIIDVFLCGIGILSAIVCILSLWMPINEIALVIIFLLAIFCIIKCLKEYRLLLNNIKKYPFSYFICVCIILVSFLMIPVWFDFVNYDPLFYHYSNIRWNETYPVIAGLGNLEERFGFNSNYLLLCALFSLRIIFGDLIIGIQSLFAALIACWIVYEVIKTNFEVKRIFLLILYFIFIYINKVDLATSSTDIIPNLATFYLFFNIILYPSRIKSPTTY